MTSGAVGVRQGAPARHQPGSHGSRPARAPAALPHQL